MPSTHPDRVSHGRSMDAFSALLICLRAATTIGCEEQCRDTITSGKFALDVSLSLASLNEGAAFGTTSDCDIHHYIVSKG